jgi:hypothetical protein
MRLLRASVFIIVAILFANPLHSHADTYQLFVLSSDDVFFYGMNDAGKVVLLTMNYQTSSECVVGGDCYISFFNGVLSGESPTPPVFDNDQGTPCTPTVPPGGKVIHGVCNGNLDAFTGSLSQNQQVNGIPGVYTGPNFDVISHFGSGPIFMNNRGDIVFDNQPFSEWVEAVDLNTLAPEPGSIVLFATGLLGLAGTLRRRFVRMAL